MFFRKFPDIFADNFPVLPLFQAFQTMVSLNRVHCSRPYNQVSSGAVVAPVDMVHLLSADHFLSPLVLADGCV